MVFSSFESKNKRKERRVLTFLLPLSHLGWSNPLAFSSPHSLNSSRCCNVELSTFLKPCVTKLCVTQARELYWAFEMQWARNVVKEVGGGRGRQEGGKVGRRGNFRGRKGGWKIPRQGKRMGFWFVPKTTWMASSSIRALVATGSFQPKNLTLNHQLLPSKECTHPTLI